MTAKNLKKALAVILSHEDNVQCLRDVYKTEAPSEAIVQRAVNEIYSEKLLKFINDNMEELPTFYINDPAFFEAKKRINETLDGNEMEPYMFPNIADKAFLVNRESQDALLAGAFDYCEYEDVYILDNGQVISVSHIYFELNDEVHINKKIDREPCSMCILYDEGLLPDNIKDFLIS